MCLGEVRILPERTLTVAAKSTVSAAGGRGSAHRPDRASGRTVSRATEFDSHRRLWAIGKTRPPTHPRTYRATEGLGTDIRAGCGARATSPGSLGPRCRPSRSPSCSRAGRSGAGRARLLGRSPRRAPARPSLRRWRAPLLVGAARDCGARAPSAPSGPGPRGVPDYSPTSPRPTPIPWLPAPVPRPAPAHTARRSSGRYCRRRRVSSYLQSAAKGSEAGPGRGGVSVKPRPHIPPLLPLSKPSLLPKGSQLLLRLLAISSHSSPTSSRAPAL